MESDLPPGARERINARHVPYIEAIEAIRDAKRLIIVPENEIDKALIKTQPGDTLVIRVTKNLRDEQWPKTVSELEAEIDRLKATLRTERDAARAIISKQHAQISQGNENILTMLRAKGRHA